MRILDRKIFFETGGLVNSLGQALVLASRVQRPKIRIEQKLWHHDVPFVRGQNYKVKPLDRDELVANCAEMLGNDSHASLNDSGIEGLLRNIARITGFEIPTRGTDRLENSLRLVKVPDAPGYYYLNVAGIGERHVALIPKPRLNGALVEAPIAGDTRGIFLRSA